MEEDQKLVPMPTLEQDELELSNTSSETRRAETMPTQ